MDKSRDRPEPRSVIVPLDPLKSLGTKLASSGNNGSFSAIARWLGQVVGIGYSRRKNRVASRPFALDVAMALDAESTQHEQKARSRMQSERAEAAQGNLDTFLKP